MIERPLLKLKQFMLDVRHEALEARSRRLERQLSETYIKRARVRSQLGDVNQRLGERY